MHSSIYCDSYKIQLRGNVEHQNFDLSDEYNFTIWIILRYKNIEWIILLKRDYIRFLLLLKIIEGLIKLHIHFDIIVYDFMYIFITLYLYIFHKYLI